jgi:hypothetical protein
VDERQTRQENEADLELDQPPLQPEVVGHGRQL